MKRISYIASTTFTANQSALFVLYPVLAERLGLSAATIAGTFACGSFLFLWGSPFWAARSEGEQRLPVLRVGIYGSIAALLSLIVLLAFGSALPAALCLGVLALSRVVYGLSASAVVPVAQALIGTTADLRERVKSLATLSMFLNLGRLFGPVLVLPLLAYSPLVILIVPLLIFFSLLPLTGKRKLAFETSMIRDFRLRDLWPNESNQQWLYILAVLTTAVLGLLQSSLGAYLQETQGLSPDAASKMMAKLLLIAGANTVFVQFLLRNFMRHPWQGSMPLGAWALGFGSLGLFFAPGPLSPYISIVILSAGIALLTPSYTSAMSLHARQEQGRSAGNLSTAHTLGYAFGGLLSSLALPFSVQMPFALAALLSCAAIALMWPIYAGRISNLIEMGGQSL